MSKVTFDAGMNITSAAKLLVMTAAAHEDEAEGEFNEVYLIATATSNPDEIVADFKRKLEESQEAYRSSPQGVAAKAASEAEVARLQKMHDELFGLLPTLDFTNDVAVLDWLCQFQEPSDRVGVKCRAVEVIAIFAANGYCMNANVGTAFNPDDRENVARYIIGQALDGLKQMWAIHHIICIFTERWKKRFEVIIV